MNCLDSNQIKALLHTAGTPADELLAHLETCSECRRLMESLSGGRSGLHTWRDLMLEYPVPASLRSSLNAVRSAAESQPVSPLDEAEWRVLLQPADAALVPSQESSEHPGPLGRLGPYEIRSVLAEGGMGTVFHARDTRLDRELAIKMIHPHLAASPEYVARFEQEARAVAALDHPNILSIYDVGELQGRPYLVMPLVRGGTLQDRLDAGERFSAEDCRRLGAQIADALAHAHEHQLLHRDLKPSNLLFDEETDRVFLADFGLVQALDQGPEALLVGTPEYMSPEQARGEKLSASSDLYSLGAVLYAMRHGASPFRHTPRTEGVLQWVASGATVKISESDSVFGSTMRGLLHPQVEQRPAAATEVKAALLRGLDTRSRWPWICLGLLPFLLFGLALWIRSDEPDFLKVGSRSFDQWGPAIAAAQAADGSRGPANTIELTQDHRVTESLHVSGPLRIIGRGQPRPLLEVAPSNRWMTVSEGSLSFEGLELRLGKTEGTSFLSISNAALNIRDCRIASALQRDADGGYNFAELRGSSELSLSDSEFLARHMQMVNVAGGSATNVELKVRLSNSDVVAARTVVVDQRAWRSFDLQFERCVVLAPNLLSYGPGRSEVGVLAVSNVINRMRSTMVVAPPNRLQQARLAWRGEGNVYTGGGIYLGPRPNPFVVTRLSEWQRIAEEVGSRQVAIRSKENLTVNPPDPFTYDLREVVGRYEALEVDFPPWSRILRE